jgi:signal transduction histidine kinase
MDNKNILQTINQSAFKLLATQSLEELSQTIVEEAKELVAADFGTIFLLGKHKLEKIYTSNSGLQKVSLSKKGYAEQVFRTRSTALLTREDIRKIDPRISKLGVKSLVILPLTHKTESIGILVMHSRTEKYFNEKHLSVLKLYTSMVSLAIIKTKSHEETKKALEMRDQFIAVASHELRTPLTSIHGYIQMLHTKFANKKTVEARWVESLYNESVRMTHLVKDLLDVNRIKQGQFAYTLSEVNSKDIIEKVIRQYRNYNSEREIVLEDKIPDKQYQVIGDAEKLRDMFAALLSNAVKFSKPHERVIVSLSHTPRNIIIKIKDFGKGIPKNDLERIFEGFYKAGKNEVQEGMGVGLMLARHVVRYHRGKITISSKENQGTTVTVALPRIKLTD